jgi:hypothetical protein
MRPKLSYANVVSTVCLFLLLAGGAAYAAGHLAKSSVGSKQLKENAVTGAKVKDQSLTGKDVNASTLGTVPDAVHAHRADTAGDADTLQGNGPGAFVRGNGTTIAARLDLNEFTEGTLMEVPGIGRVTVYCHVPTVQEVTFVNNSGGTLLFEESLDGTPNSFEAIADGGEHNQAPFGDHTTQIQVSTAGSPPTVATIELTETANGPKARTVYGQATVAK